MPRRLVLLVVVVAGLVAGCGGSGAKDAPKPSGVPPVAPRASATPAGDDQPPAPVSAQGSVTKNTSRLGGATPAQDAAAVALATFPSRAPDLRPQAVAVADAGDWHAAISAGALMTRAVRAPLLLSEDGELDASATAALRTLEPTGLRRLRGATVLAVGAGAARPSGQRVTAAGPRDAARMGAAVDDLLARATRRRSRAVIVAGSAKAAAPYAMPAAGLAAKTGAPVLWTAAGSLDPATRAAIRKREDARIYVVGPPAAVGEGVVKALRKLGRVQRIAGADPITNAVAVARYGDGGFGWRVVDPGHGFVFAAHDRTADAGAAAPLSASGTYGPLLLVQDPRELPRAVEEYLLDVQPGYDADPVRGVYNRGWIIGDEDAVSSPVQARIDGLLEIQPVG